jgi:thiosulfate dehydrogenase (quinone) large subunit
MDKKEFNNLQLTALVVMRVFIGWHFLYEGIAKMMKGTWSAAGYLMQAKGITAGIFHWMANTPTVLTIVNQMNMWGLVAIGLGLIVGCFTRIASVAGMFLILLYYVCNPLFVGYYYSIPMEGNYMIINKNLVELAALFVIAVTPTGQFAGIDRILCKFFKKV